MTKKSMTKHSKVTYSTDSAARIASDPAAKEIRSAATTILDSVKWEPIEEAAAGDGELPYATHSGTFRVGLQSLRVYRLNTGLAIIDARDLDSLFGFDGVQPEPTDQTDSENTK